MYEFEERQRQVCTAKLAEQADRYAGRGIIIDTWQSSGLGVREKVADQSLKAYQAAISTAMTDLPPTDPIRLGLALNLSILYYEILDSPERFPVTLLFSVVV
ncbi:hypothetical protein HPP92_011202 [Vanilla planifolia]|uniref:14-3-3 domain-containing protein n=1 Tax=Vanilla planifolia TaxID=51239 RepID=A0A835R1E8_VANPL|nr:hypothetical protein HPP92_011202 [Vanilla planifolia]